LVKRLKSLFGKDYGVIIQIVEKNFRRVTEKHDPVPVAVAGLEADIECRKVLDVGNSKGLSFKEAWLTLTSYKEYVNWKRTLNVERCWMSATVKD